MLLNCVVLEKTVESSLDCKEIQPVHPKGSQSWLLIFRTDAEAPILWSSDAKSWLIRKDHDAGKDWRQEGKGTREDEMAGWHYQLNGLEFEQAPGGGEGQGSLGCCSPWSRKELDTTERLNNSNKLCVQFLGLLDTAHACSVSKSCRCISCFCLLFQLLNHAWLSVMLWSVACQATGYIF